MKKVLWFHSASNKFGFKESPYDKVHKDFSDFNLVRKDFSKDAENFCITTGIYRKDDLPYLIKDLSRILSYLKKLVEKEEKET